MIRSFLPITTIVIFILFVWYCFSIVLNSSWAYDRASRNSQTLTLKELVHDTWSQKKPKLPAPHQVFSEMWETTFNKKVTSKRALVYHTWITLSGTIAGFLFGTILGIILGTIIFGIAKEAFFYIPGIDGSFYRVFLGAVLVAAALTNENIRKRIIGSI